MEIAANIKEASAQLCEPVGVDVAYDANCYLPAYEKSGRLEVTIN